MANQSNGLMAEIVVLVNHSDLAFDHSFKGILHSNVVYISMMDHSNVKVP